MIQARRQQQHFGEGLIAEEVSDLREEWMKHADQVLADEQLLAIVYEALARRSPKSRTRGRHGTPAEVVLRLLLWKHIRNWSYEVLEREVRANLVYRDFTRVGAAKAPDAKTMGRWGLALGPEGVQKLHERVVEIARENQVVKGRKMRLDTTVVETDIHYRMSSKCWCIQRESTPPGQESEPCSLGGREEGNQILRVHRRSRPWDGERVIGP